MKAVSLFCILTWIAGTALAQQQVPASAQPAPVPSVSPPAGQPPIPPALMPLKGPAGQVDKFLGKLTNNQLPPPNFVDQEAENDINRQINVGRSVGQVLRPVGYAQIGTKRSIYASEDGKSFQRLIEGGRIGLMKLTKITEYGVEYSVGGKQFYAPLAMTMTDPPKSPGTAGGSQTGANGLPPAAMNPVR